MARKLTIAEVLRRTIEKDGRSLLQLSKDSDVAYAAVYRIAHGERDGMTLDTAGRLAAALGLTLELRPAGRGKRKG